MNHDRRSVAKFNSVRLQLSTLKESPSALCTVLLAHNLQARLIFSVHEIAEILAVAEALLALQASGVSLFEPRDSAARRRIRELSRLDVGVMKVASTWPCQV
jgi:hypothetical protein